MTLRSACLFGWLCSVGVLCFAGQQQSDSVSFRARGVEIPLSSDSKQRLAGKIQNVMSRCMFDSVHYPKFFEHFKPAQDWEQTMAEDRLYVRFARPFRSANVEGHDLEISEALMGLQDDDFLKAELTRHAGQVVAHSKCDGYGMLGIMCDPALAAYLRPGQVKMCQNYREQRQRASPANSPASEERPAPNSRPAPSQR
ncbi:MAG: hypothetical protein HY649_07800 [Acidobacteria bacterium]|nr:hypothetical protein [Acidobacteriota bacterium]